MLVLSRKLQEAVIVGGTDGSEHLLKVVVLEIKRGRVKLGFDVDSRIPVHRGEIWERVQNNGSSNDGPDDFDKRE